MKLGKLLVLFLIPLALFFVSCENEIPEEFQIELSEYLYGADLDSILEQIGYFNLNLYKISEIQTDNGPSIDSELLFPDIILNKGDILKLDGLEPGLYELNGQAWSISGDYVVYGIVGKSNKMVTVNDYDYIVVDDDSPTIVKLVLGPI